MLPALLLLTALLVATDRLDLPDQLAPARAPAVADDPVVVVLAPAPRPSPTLSLEWFVLERSNPDGRVDVLGTARWLRRASEAEVQLELETAWVVPSRARGQGAGILRVYHVETSDARGSRLVWREVGAGGGRSLIAETGVDRALLGTTQWTARDTCTRDLAFGARARLPLELLELARAGSLPDGAVAVFDPLACTVAARVARTLTTGSGETGSGAPGSGETGSGAEGRTLELRDLDENGAPGALVTRWTLAGPRLVGFELASGVRARAVAESEYLEAETRLAGADPSAARTP